MLSVIIPTYNRQVSTNKAIASIISQDIETEIIVIDDASDSAFQLSEENSQYEIQVIHSKTNKGPSATRNLGLEIASHSLVSFLDSDDYLLPDTLKERVEYAVNQELLTENHRNKIVGCSWQETNKDRAIVNTRYPLATRSSDDFYLGCWFCPGSTVIANRHFLQQIQPCYDETLKRLEDWDLFIKLAQLGASYIPQETIGVSIAASDSRHPEIVIEACEQIRKKYLVNDNDNALNDTLKKKFKSYLFYELSRAYLSKREYHSALDYLVKSFIQNPRTSLYPGPGWASNVDDFRKSQQNHQ